MSILFNKLLEWPTFAFGTGQDTKTFFWLHCFVPCFLIFPHIETSVCDRHFFCWAMLILKRGSLFFILQLSLLLLFYSFLFRFRTRFFKEVIADHSHNWRARWDIIHTFIDSKRSSITRQTKILCIVGCARMRTFMLLYMCHQASKSCVYT